MIIHILTYSPSPEQIYGNLLALRTARVGFPNSEIIVTDNCSCSEARDIFKDLCKEHDYGYRQLIEPINHHDHLSDTIDSATGLIIFLDPDVCLFENCKNMLDDCNPNILIKGMLETTRFGYCGDPSNEIQQTTMARIHTSFLIITDPQRLRQTYPYQLLTAIFGNAWQPKIHQTLPGHRRFFDTGALVYTNTIQYTQPFSANEMDCFSHLYAGTHLDQLVPLRSPGFYLDSHAAAQTGDYNKLRGLWRHQETFRRDSFPANLIRSV